MRVVRTRTLFSCGPSRVFHLTEDISGTPPMFAVHIASRSHFLHPGPLPTDIPLHCTYYRLIRCAVFSVTGDVTSSIGEYLVEFATVL